jgi:hypothetical protein
MKPSRPSLQISQNAQVFIIIIGVLLLSIYFLLRFHTYWGENDTSTFTTIIRDMLASGSLQPENGEVYSNGYGYPGLVALLISMSGLTTAQMQSIAMILFMIWLVLPAWLLYREFSNSSKVATLATVILFIQPEFLFPLLRGTHEKFTRGLMLLCLFLLVRSLRSRHNLRLFTGFVVAFYLTAYAMITFNNLMAFSFIAAIGLALGLSWVALRRQAQITWLDNPMIQRLFIIVVSLLVVTFVFTFYAYPPAQEQLHLMQSVQDRLASLLLQVEETAVNPYQVINAGWINLPVYLLVSVANWLLLLISMIIWLSQSYRWIFKRQTLPEYELLLWAFYGAFAFIGVLSIAIDISGAIASNLQHRVFPSFAMLAAPIVAGWLLARSRPQPGWTGRVFRFALTGLVVVLAFLSVFKATNEPLLSNNWIFYLPSEHQALRWADQNSQNSTIWTEFNERLVTSFNINNGLLENGNQLTAFILKTLSSNYLISDVTRLRSDRLDLPLPIQGDSLKVYDNGETEIYRLRPTTPYQR